MQGPLSLFLHPPFTMLSLFVLIIDCGLALCGVPNKAFYDYVIVGGGTSGLVIANRLSENPAITVAVIEAGNSVLNSPNVTNTTTYGLSLGTSIDWSYPIEPQKYALNRTLVYHAGKALGGTSTINGIARCEFIPICLSLGADRCVSN